MDDQINLTQDDSDVEFNYYDDCNDEPDYSEHMVFYPRREQDRFEESRDFYYRDKI